VGEGRKCFAREDFDESEALMCKARATISLIDHFSALKRRVRQTAQRCSTADRALSLLRQCALPGDGALRRVLAR
jgi:hypothetical protein